jgi:amidase
MTKSVRGAAMLLTLMADEGRARDFAAGLDKSALAGKRIGVARFGVGRNPAVIALFDAALADLKAAGAELVEIPIFETDPQDLGALEDAILKHEFKATINAYLAGAAPAVETRDLQALIAFNKAHADEELALFDQSILEEAEKTRGLSAPGYRKALKAALRATREKGIDRLLRENKVEALVAPSGPLASPVDAINGDVWPGWAGIGGLAAIAGYPHLTVPMGTVKGLPVGISFIGGRDRDAEILSFGYAYEQSSGKRVDPLYLSTAADAPAIGEAMSNKVK